MKSKDQLLLEEAYNRVATQNEIIDEGVWSQIKGLGSGIAAGVKTGAQNLAAGAAKAVGVKVDDTNRQTMGQAYAKAQQGSMLKGFQTSAEKTVNDFINDAKKMGVDLNDPNIIKQFPEAAAAYKEVQNLLNYIKNPASQPAIPSSTTPPATTATAAASAPTKKARTGGKIAGQTSSTPNATKQRAARAAAKTATKGSAASTTPSVPSPAPAASSAPQSSTTTSKTVKTSTGSRTTY